MNKIKEKSIKTIIILNLIFSMASLLVGDSMLNVRISASNTVYTEQSHEDDMIIKSVRDTRIVKEEIPVEEPAPTPQLEEKITVPPDPNETINGYISEICKSYPLVGQALIKSIVYHESRYNPQGKNGNCLGLMQVSSYWHADRARKLGVTDFYDPYSNILLGVDYLSELLTQYKDITLVLMLYNMDHETALKLSRGGVTSNYARSVLAKAEEYKKGE